MRDSSLQGMWLYEGSRGVVGVVGVIYRCGRSRCGYRCASYIGVRYGRCTCT